MVEERKLNYNPADYAEVQRQSKDMDKKSLEDFYVLTKDKKYTSCGAGWAIAIGVIVAIAALITLGFTFADDILKNKVSDNILEISEEICPILGEGYISDEVLHSDFDETRIICNEFNSIPIDFVPK